MMTLFYMPKKAAGSENVRQRLVIRRYKQYPHKKEQICDYTFPVEVTLSEPVA